MTASDENNAKGKEQKTEIVLKRLDALEKNLDLLDAAKSRDWNKVEKLWKDGAKITFRQHAVINLIAAASDLDAVKLLQKIETSEKIIDLALVSAVQAGRKDSVEYILNGKQSGKTLAHAFSIAVDHERHEIADLLFQHLTPADITEHEFYSVLNGGRGDLYLKMIEMPVTKPPLYLSHFGLAAEKNLPEVAEYLSSVMTPAWAFSSGNDSYKVGGSLEAALSRIMPSGNTGYLGAIFRLFPPDPSETEDIVKAAVMSNNRASLEFCLNKYPQPDRVINPMIQMACRLDKPMQETVRYLCERDMPVNDACHIWTPQVFARGETSENFFWALEKGISIQVQIPQTLVDTTTGALSRKHTDIIDYLADKGYFTTYFINIFKESSDYDTLKLAAKLGNDIHFKDDRLFWHAVMAGDRDFVDAFPKGRYPSTADIPLVTEAFLALAERNDIALFDKVFGEIQHEPPTLRAILKGCVASHDMAVKAVEAGIVPGPLTADEMRLVAYAGKTETLAFLGQKGFTYDADIAAKGLADSISRNDDMAGYFLSRGAKPQDDTILLSAAEVTGDKDVTRLLMKWYSRERVIADPELPAVISDTPADRAFDGENSPAIRAAYADQFHLLVKKLASEGAAGTLPEKMVATRDSYGNNILDILGAHGRLGDILLPELWMKTNGVEFIGKNAEPVYQAQCDMGLLKAGVDNMKLKTRAPKHKLQLRRPGQ